ncbi:hypothetical protein Tco_1205032, partial [Tanacetum coccineum]
GNPQYALQDQEIFDTGYFRHMTGNKSYLTDYQDIDGGFVAFDRSPKRGKITGKGKIRTGKLDFKDVYFVKEFKFNLFSVSQMCDKKNNILFTETECLILSPDFKLLDESQVLLKVPRQNNMYSFNLKNVVPSGASRPDITFAVCAYARFQVTPKTSHLHAVKRIFLLESKRLISWQCKKKTIIANSTTEVEYVAAANYYRQVLWIQNQMLDYGFNFMNTKIYIDNESTICVVKNPVFHSKTKHIEIRQHFIRDSYEKKLIQVIKIHTDHNVAYFLTKAFDVSRFNFLIASIGLLNP